MSRRRFNPWLAAAFVAGILYPPFVYFSLQSLPHSVPVAVGLALIGVRLLGLRHEKARIWKTAFILAAVAMLVLLSLDATLATRAYPVVISLTVAIVFGLSLIFPPSIIERIARLTEPDLPLAGVIYTRRVTMLWAAFLFLNALISASTALWGTWTQWTLWNGCISYLLMGALFIGEFIVRRRVRA